MLDIDRMDGIIASFIEPISFIYVLVR